MLYPFSCRASIREALRSLCRSQEKTDRSSAASKPQRFHVGICDIYLGSGRFPSKCCLGRNTCLHGPWQKIQKHYGPCRKVERRGARDHRCLEHGKLVSVRPSSVSLCLALLLSRSLCLSRSLSALIVEAMAISFLVASNTLSLSLSLALCLSSPSPLTSLTRANPLN